MPDIIISATDANFFEFAKDAFDSLIESGAKDSYELGLFDLGLNEEQKAYFTDRGVELAKPRWTVEPPEGQRADRYYAYVIRAFLPEFFPGRRVYFWFDADAWIQRPSCLNVYREGALKNGFSIAQEDDRSYRRKFFELKWWYGNLLAAFGPLAGARLLTKPMINCGLFAAHHDAPHWKAWSETYKRAVAARGRLIIEQHALHAAIFLNRLPYSSVGCEYNWICTLSSPAWDEARGLLCKPYAPYDPISVVHLAGPDKSKPYLLKTTAGGKIEKTLRYLDNKQVSGRVPVSAAGD